MARFYDKEQWIWQKESGQCCGAVCVHGTLTLARGSFVNFDFPLAHVLANILRLRIKRIVISYDIACKYHIHFRSRIVNTTWPLLNTDQLAILDQAKIIWLVPKFHLAAHVEGCADQFSFNWTVDVGRTCGESVETNWASLNLLATATREMGFGHRRETLSDAMLDWNWRKAINGGKKIIDGLRNQPDNSPQPLGC